MARSSSWLLGFPLFIASFCPRLSWGAPDWVSLTLTGPNGVPDFGNFYYYVNNILVGTPPTTESLALHLSLGQLLVSSEDCAFCPASGTELFNPSLSSTYHMINPSWSNNNTDLGGVRATDTVSFGGVLISQNTSFNLIERMSHNFTARVADGLFGLFVDPANKTARDLHILTRLHDSGQLLNPVVGLRLGNDLNASRITIGALDPNDYEGTINWVQAETPDPSWDAPAVIQIDGFRGFNGSFLPFPNPLLTYLETLNLEILIPNADTYFFNPGYIGVPADQIDKPTDGGAYGILCNQTGGAYASFSVAINGINYQVDSQDNLLSNQSAFNGFCAASLGTFETTAAVPSLLGTTFLRSVYLAYRFPTDDCPNAYYGFAFPKNSNRTSSMIAQQPRETPSLSAQCLSLVKPTSTPAVSTPSPQVSAFAKGSYSVLGSPDAPQVTLKGVDDLKAGLVQDSLDPGGQS